MPKASVIITTYNRPQLLVRSVESAFKSGTDVEVIVVDDASIDETAEVCHKLKNIKYIRADRNQQTAGARNLGILASSSPYLAFLDDDDWRLPGSLDKQIAILDENPNCGMVYGQFLLADQNSHVIDNAPFPLNIPQGDIFYQLFEENIVGCLTAVFRKECIYKIGLLDPSYSGIDDWDLWIRIAELYSVLALKEPVAVWRKAEADSGQGSSNAEKLFNLSVKACRDKWSKLPRARKNIDFIEKQDVYQGKMWLESKIEHLENHIKQIDKGKDWLEVQCDNWRNLAEAREKQIEEILEGKNWLENQYYNWKTLADDREKYINQLLEEKEIHKNQ